MCDQPITTDAGFAAYLRNVHTANFMRDEKNPFPDLPGAAWEKTMGWTVTQAFNTSSSMGNPVSAVSAADDSDATSSSTDPTYGEPTEVAQ